MCFNLLLESSMLAFQGVPQHVGRSSQIRWHSADFVANKLDFL